MLEIEVKYRVEDFASVEDRLRRLEARPTHERDEVDAYFNAPHRDFAQTDEACRVRSSGEQNVVTYKGPRLDGATKSRPEIEVALAPGSAAARDFQRILLALGFRATATVRKHRRVFALDRSGYHLEVCLDDVERVGTYVELEILAPETDLAAARAVVLGVASELGLGEAERRSYLELFLQSL